MKIAIQGHPARGDEVIQILKSLGGKNTALRGTFPTFYYIDNKNEIINAHDKFLRGYKLYTLKEFKKEFPFKVGDVVSIKGVNKPHEIIALEGYMDKLCYKLDNGLYYNPDILTTYKEMKEERNITLTLEKAKEWYNKGGELKEIALQAFSEKELNPLPRSWEEFCEKYPIQDHEAFINYATGNITVCKACAGSGLGVWKRKPEKDRCKCVSQRSAEAHLAMMQLEQLRDCYRGLFITVIGMPVWCIRRWRGELIIEQRVWGTNETFLSFQSKEVTEEYLKNFKPLIEKAGDLI